MSDLVERLRSVYAAGPTHGTFFDPVPDPLSNEAAAEIERLSGLLERAVTAGEKLGEQNTELQALVKELQRMLGECSGGFETVCKEADSYRKALRAIRDATHTNAVTLRGMADRALK